ncbi:sucrose-6-phosphate hydrolase [Metabacillus sp. GX 13764]|uniref:glycoside hydrolase family 32 protein n=1 Tax=Metabacillus kandeliae TaxID=2900151 RepID=UPI001E4F68FF|nr:sucrose-6-phosphate hydrolase [Metabacillus kandeliae]MCD7035487.1 sucrose-6-phosphate hydrolase [Metabacillus kandeliae]
MNSEYREKLEKAAAHAEKRGQEISRTPFRPGYHITAQAGWINDPNGLIQYKGEYHVFFQYHPFSAEWGPMYWGHAVSNDLVRWEHLPPALAPFEEYDKDGCFSGSAVEENGELVLFYTGNVWLKDSDEELVQVQCAAKSKDGREFIKLADNPVLSRPPEGASNHFRDPKVWKEDGKWHMVLGCRMGDSGQVLYYHSHDLFSWEYQGVLAESTSGKNLGFMWECPDFFEISGQRILLISPEGMEAEGENYRNLKQTGYFCGSFQNGVFQHGEFSELDKGHDFYAAQTFQDEKGRRLLFGWMDMWEQEMPSQRDGWAGALTLPRELEMSSEGKLRMKPVKELEKLRQKELAYLEDVSMEGENVLAFGDLLELKAVFDISKTSAGKFGFKLRSGASGETAVFFEAKEQKVYLDREHSGEGPKGIRSAEVSVNSGELLFHLFLDRSSVELFVNDGETAMTSRIYPDQKSLALKLFAEGGRAKAKTVSIWRLEDIWEEKHL